MCDVCGKSESAGVACSAFGALSWSFCAECLAKPAEPEVAFAYLYEDVSDEGVGLAEWVDQFSTFKDGKYLTWREYVELRRAEKPPE